MLLTPMAQREKRALATQQMLSMAQHCLERTLGRFGQPFELQPAE